METEAATLFDADAKVNVCVYVCKGERGRKVGGEVVSHSLCPSHVHL